MADLSDEDIEFIQELREAREEEHISKRDVLKALGMVGAGGVVGATGAGMATQNVKADASTTDSDGDVGGPSNRVDGFFDGVDATSVSADTVNTDNEVAGYGAGGNLIKHYAVSNYADLGAAVNQAIADGGVRLILPDVDQTYSTTIEASESDRTVSIIAPPGATYTFDGTDRAVWFRDGDNKLEGGRWQYNGTDGGAGNVAGIELSSDDTAPANDNTIAPSQVYSFHKGIYLRAEDGGGVNYNVLDFRAMVKNKHGIYVEPSSTNTTQSNVVYGWRIGDPSASDSRYGFTFDATDQVITGWAITGSCESLNRVINIKGSNVVAGISAELYLENNTTIVADPDNIADEVYVKPLWNRHAVTKIYQNTRNRTNITSIADGDGNPSSVYEKGIVGSADGFGWYFDDSYQMAIARSGSDDYVFDLANNPINKMSGVKNFTTSGAKGPASGFGAFYVSDGSDNYQVGDLVYEYNDGSGVNSIRIVDQSADTNVQ